MTTIDRPLLLTLLALALSGVALCLLAPCFVGWMI